MIKRVVIIFLFCSSAAFACAGLDYYTYFGTTAETYRLAFIPGQGAETHEIRLFNHEKSIYIDMATIAGNEYDILLPKTGHYSVEVRSCNKYQCSTWSKSINPAESLVDGKPRAWWLYGHVAPPGPLGMPF